MATYAAAGNRNTACNEEESAIQPAIRGSTAPPIMAMHSNPDVAAAEAELRSRVIVKMVGNMIELNSPTAIAQTAAASPTPWVTARHRIAAIAAARASRRVARKRV